MALVAAERPWGPGPHPVARSLGAAVFVWLLLGTWCTAPAGAIQVTVSDPYHVVILFQPVTLPCSYQMTMTPTAPIVVWKYKSFCRDRVADAFSPASVDNQINAQLAAGNPGYNPYVECQDSVRTVRVVATKQGNTVTLGDYYQGRRITITGSRLCKVRGGGARGVHLQVSPGSSRAPAAGRAPSLWPSIPPFIEPRDLALAACHAVLGPGIQQ